MTLRHAISDQYIEDIKANWPSGMNFKNKSQFIGITHKAIGAHSEVCIPLEMLESNDWGVSFRPMDKGTIDAIKGLFEHLGGAVNPRDKAIMKAGFDHPCRETCSGWKMGFDRGRYESEKEITELKYYLRKLTREKWAKKRREIFDGLRWKWNLGKRLSTHAVVTPDVGGK